MTTPAQPPRESKFIECEVCGCRFNKGKARGFRMGGGLCPNCAKRWLKPIPNPYPNEENL